MNLVVDTSVIVKWFVKEADHGRARELLDAEHDLAAPDFAVAEVANVLWRRQRLGDIGSGEVDEAVRRLPLFFKTLAPASELVNDGLQIARVLGHSVYDCMFLALAIALPGARPVTADERFIARTENTDHAKWLVQLSALPASQGN